MKQNKVFILFTAVRLAIFHFLGNSLQLSYLETAGENASVFSLTEGKCPQLLHCVKIERQIPAAVGLKETAATASVFKFS